MFGFASVAQAIELVIFPRSELGERSLDRLHFCHILLYFEFVCSLELYIFHLRRFDNVT